jgi:hypothetical protein
MRLKTVHIRTFKNILDSTEVLIQTDVTSLVGKNESGKTAFLQALYCLNPARPNIKLNSQRQYPAWLEKRHRMEGIDLAAVNPVEALFELDESDLSQLEAQFGRDVIASREIILRRNYADELEFDFELDEAVAMENVISKVDIGQELKHSLGSVSCLEQFNAMVQDLKNRDGDENEPLRATAAALERAVGEMLRGATTMDEAVDGALAPLAPKFFYFDEYANLPGVVKIRELLQADEHKLRDDQITALSLLRMAGADKDYLLNPDYETRKRELENVANAITDEVLRFWTTNPELRVEIDISQRTVALSPPQAGHHAVLDELRIRLYDNRHLLSLAFDERSTGFRWFFSFIAAFSRYLYSKEPVILLLDEPGLGLHARAQKDFLNFIDKRLAERCQVLYTTHSPFMVQPGKLDRVRVVEDRGRDKGSSVSSDVLTTDPDTLFPLQGALGYDLAQNLFIGQDNLIVEGTSDFTYITLLSDWLRANGRSALDARWTVVPVGGIDMVPTFVALLGIHLDLTVLVDARKQGHQRLSSLAQKGYLSQKRIITIGEMLNVPAADIEDLFEVADYLVLYNGAFGKSLVPASFSGSDPIVNRIARFESIERYDHGRPAEFLLRHRDEILPKLSERTVTNFESLESVRKH